MKLITSKLKDLMLKEFCYGSVKSVKGCYKMMNCWKPYSYTVKVAQRGSHIYLISGIHTDHINYIYQFQLDSMRKRNIRGLVTSSYVAASWKAYLDTIPSNLMETGIQQYSATFQVIQSINENATPLLLLATTT